MPPRPPVSAPVGVAILGATGSIGRSALDVIGRFPKRFHVTALFAGSDAEALSELARQFRPKIVGLYDHDAVSRLSGLPRGTRVVVGEEGMVEAVVGDETRTVLAAASGVASIRPVLRAASLGKRIALANKELLVMAGAFVTAAAKTGKAELLPVDSEHSAVFQALAGHRKEDVASLILTASGGPFREASVADMRKATVAEALGHPTWRMGRKITVDSATMMNKGLEVIEASWLFGIDSERISVVVHPQSVVHSMVEYRDGSVIAQLGVPDMRIPIAYAFSYPERLPMELPPLAPHLSRGWTFEQPDRSRFPALRIAYEAAAAGGSVPAVMNAANEVAVSAFLEGRILFTEIASTVENVMGRVKVSKPRTLDDVLEADAVAREAAETEVGRIARRQRRIT